VSNLIGNISEIDESLGRHLTTHAECTIREPRKLDIDTTTNRLRSINTTGLVAIGKLRKLVIRANTAVETIGLGTHRSVLP
jgi:hypothetical protein